MITLSMLPDIPGFSTPFSKERPVKVPENLSEAQDEIYILRRDLREQKAGNSLRYLMGGAVGALLAYGMFSYQNRLIPKDAAMEPGFPKPSQLEVSLEDQNHNGPHELVLQVQNKPYLLKVENGKAVLKEYEVKAPQVIEK